MRHQESRLQTACVRWFRLAYPQHAWMLFAVPNGVATSATQGRVLKNEGMLAGVSDLILLTAGTGGHALALEFKTPKGRQSPQQKMFQQECTKHGNGYAVIRTFEEFRETVERWLGE